MRSDSFQIRGISLERGKEGRQEVGVLNYCKGNSDETLGKLCSDRERGTAVSGSSGAG